MSRRSNAIKNLNPAIYISLSTLFSYVLLTVIAFFASLVCNGFEDPSSMTGILSFVSLLLTAAIGSFVISKLRGESGALCGILAAALFVTVRIVISLFLSGTDLSDLLDCLSYLGTGTIFALLGQKRLGKRRR